MDEISEELAVLLQFIKGAQEVPNPAPLAVRLEAVRERLEAVREVIERYLAEGQHATDDGATG